MGILEKVLYAMNLEESSPEISFAIERVESFMKEYCGFEEIPLSANTLWCEMVCSLLQWEDRENQEVGGGLAALTMGDVSYSFHQERADVDMNNLLFDYKPRLNRLRKGFFR